MRRKQITGIILCCLMCMLAIPNISSAAENSGGSWIQTEQGKRYQNADSTYTAGRWLFIDNGWFLFDTGGYVLTGWQKTGTTWYYMNQSGVMQTGWLSDNGKWYYLAESGAMRTGWVREDSSWYYMDSSGVMKTGWVKAEDKWYYLADTGKMVLGTKTFDASVYKFDTDGALSSVSATTEDKYGNYNVAVYNDNEQILLDYIVGERGKILTTSSKAIVVDQTLNAVAEARLNAALTYGYYEKGKTITGMGTVKDYLKTINYKTNKSCTEVYVRALEDIEDALKTGTNLKNFDGTNYNYVGISVQEKNDKLYAMVVYMK